MPSPYKAAFFDFGGTLYSYRNKGLGLRDVLTALVQELGATPDAGSVRDAFRAASRDAYAAHLPRDFYLHRDLFEDTYRRFAVTITGDEPGPELLRWCHEQQCARVIANFELRADCLETLRALRAAGLHVAIVSNIDDDYLHPMIDRAALHEVLDAWTSSEEAGSCKPHDAIFRTALGKAGCGPTEALFVGDALEADVAGANPLGMTSVYLRADGLPEAPAEGPQPAHTVSALSEILGLVSVASS
ncbi:MAG: HAD family hydrolase [Candidatus Binatia bacterium]|nr:HAD family hydrolase [Candidatus Binatia bacterium]